ncbi:MAG: type IV conjugative transfer system protein TraL [Alphaproteobacteria bacterium]|jgi:type IV conjugative transfer system protein TraL|nr:type IV conjugative transfer system protein TraL [Candidatus Jidaibacter sp.]
MANLEEFYIPRTLDEPAKILFWPYDEGLVLLAPIGLGIILGYNLFGMISGLALFIGWRKLKGSNQSNYIIGLAYWYLPPWFIKFKKTPPSHYRIFRR